MATVIDFNKAKPCVKCKTIGTTVLVAWDPTPKLTTKTGKQIFRLLERLPTGDIVEHEHRAGAEEAYQNLKAAATTTPATPLGTFSSAQIPGTDPRTFSAFSTGLDVGGKPPSFSRQESTKKVGRWVYKDIVAVPLDVLGLEGRLEQGYEPVVLSNGSIQLAQHPQGSRIVMVKRKWVTGDDNEEEEEEQDRNRRAAKVVENIGKMVERTAVMTTATAASQANDNNNTDDNSDIYW